MDCPKCGTKNPDDANVCSSCSAELSKAPVGTEKIVPKTSGLAIAAFVLGILSLFTCGLTIIPAIVLGIISFILIEKNSGRLTGTNFSILGVIIPVCAFLVLGILLPALLHVRKKAYRMTCGTNLAGIGMAILVYTNDYDDQLPRSGGKDTTWANRIPDWNANDRIVAYGLDDEGSGGQGSITSCFYLLVKYAKESPKSFICRGDKGTTAFNPDKEGVGKRALPELWDFGPEPSKHCSYSYHMPFGQYALTTSSDPYMAVAADRNPLQDSPAAKAKQWPGIYNPDGGIKAVRYGNAIAHQEDAQNVLFMDCHVGQEKRPFCGVNDDNIYTFWDGGDIRIGAPPQVGRSGPQDRLDSLLVHDGL